MLLTAADEAVVDDLLIKIEAEYQRPGEWQHQMLSAYLTVLLTYLSRAACIPSSFRAANLRPTSSC